jgi:DNA-binding transcriptional LysR family regulator
VVETGSFSAAARQVGTTPSAVSRSVARLERALNTRLLHRTTRKLRLSDTGQDVWRCAQEMLRAAQTAVQAARRTEPEPAGRLRIAAPRALGRFLIHPLIPAFLRAYPQVDVVFRLDDRTLDPIDEGLDLVFRITDTPPPGMMGRRLMRVEHVLCASPAYLRAHPAPNHPRELRAHSCITLSEEVEDARWHFSKGGRRLAVDVKGRYVANHSGVRLDAVLGDLGIGSLPGFVAQPALQAGQVVRVLPDWDFQTNYHGDVWMLYPPSRHPPLRLRAFIDHMVAHAGARPPATAEDVPNTARKA